MNVYVFGNEDVPEDTGAIETAKRLEGTVEGASFIFVRPNEDLSFAGESRVVILDTVQGIRDVVLIEGSDLDRFVLPPRGTAHDFDLAFQLRYLRKLGRLGDVTVIGMPLEGGVDYMRIQSIFRELVAQDMQGS